MRHSLKQDIHPFHHLILVIVIGLLAFVTIYPVALTFIGSFTDEASLLKNGYRLLPDIWSLRAYEYLFDLAGLQIIRSYGVTITITLVGTVISVLFTLLCAYALSNADFAWRNGISFIIFFTMLFNVGLVPSYILMVQVYGLRNSLWALILPLLVNPFNIIVLRTFIKMSVHTSLIESAQMDGANHYTILFQIVAPLSKAGIATIAFFNMLAYWNDWFNAMLYIEDLKLLPIQALLQRITSAILWLTQNAGVVSSTVHQSPPSITMQLALNVIATTPILVAYPFFQKYFISGLTVGAVKS